MFFRNAGKIFLKYLICNLMLLLIMTKYRMAIFKAKRRAIRNKNQKAIPVLMNDTWTVKDVPADLQYDFLKHRTITYISPILRAYDRYYSYLLNIASCPQEIISVPDDETFLNMLYRTPAGLYVRRINSSKDVIDLSALIYVQTFFGYYDISKIEVDIQKRRIVFFTKNNEKITPEDSLYRVARQSAVICLVYFIVGIGHSWVHFNFPCIFSAATYNRLPRESVLYKIIGTHSRFNIAINYQALYVRRSTNNTNNLKGKLDPVKPFPMTSDEFIFNNSRRTLDFYKENGEFHCPPRLDENIPYCGIIMLYYYEIKKFIENMKVFIEIDLLAALIEEISLYLPVIKEFDPYDVLATYIWQCSVLHSTDHYTFYQIMKLYGSPVAKKRIVDCLPDMKMDDLVDMAYQHKFQSFLDVFVFFKQSPLLKNNMKNLNYGFNDVKQIAAEKDFIRGLEKLENDLEAKGQLLCPLKNMAQSICF